MTVLTQGLAPLPTEALQQLDAHARVERLGDTELLRVSFLGREAEVDDAALRALQPVADHIAELVLARTRITDAAATELARMPRLVRLDLRETAAGDACTRAAADLQHLRALNLFGSKVTDAGLAELARCTSLRQLWLWQTEVSAAAVVALGAKLPTARIVFAPDLPEPPAGDSAPPRRRGGK